MVSEADLLGDAVGALGYEEPEAGLGEDEMLLPIAFTLIAS